MPATIARPQLRIVEPASVPEPSPSPETTIATAEWFLAMGWEPADFLSIQGISPSEAMPVVMAMATLKASGR